MYFGGEEALVGERLEVGEVKLEAGGEELADG